MLQSNWSVGTMHKFIKCTDDFIEYFSRVEQDVLHDSYEEFIKAKKTKKPQQWNPVDSIIFSDLAHKAFIGNLSEDDIKLIDTIADTFLYNYHKLYINTIICGHTQENPHYLISEMIGDDCISEKRVSKVANAFCEYIANDAFSDYAFPKLYKFLEPAFLQSNPNLRVQAMVEFINVTHCRGNIAEFFISEAKYTPGDMDWLFNGIDFPIFSEKNLKGLVIENDSEIDEYIEKYINDNGEMFSNIEIITNALNVDPGYLFNLMNNCDTIIVKSNFLYKQQLESFVHLFQSGLLAPKNLLIYDIWNYKNIWSKKKYDYNTGEYSYLCKEFSDITVFNKQLDKAFERNMVVDIINNKIISHDK